MIWELMVVLASLLAAEVVWRIRSWPFPLVIVPPEIRALAEARQSARARRDWAEADALRAQLTAAGWALRESADGYDMRPVSGESP